MKGNAENKQQGKVRAYYDANTRFFLTFGGSDRARSIHRSLWPPGVTSLERALNISNEMIAAELRDLAAGRLEEGCLLADLGCGVGGTLLHLVDTFPGEARAVGVTISAVQARMAEQARRDPQLASRVLFLQGDFHALPLAAVFDFVFSVEAFIHAASPEAYLAQAAAVLKPGGRLLLVDDFLSSASLPTQAQAWVEAYRRGWHAQSLIPLAQLDQTACACGLRLLRQVDLTPLLRLRALPDAAASTLRWLGDKLPLRHPLATSMIGSMALQQCLQSGWLGYHLLVFEKTG